MDADRMTFFDDDTNDYQQANIWLKEISVLLDAVSAMTAASPKLAALPPL